jgi:hypothetical protein
MNNERILDGAEIGAEGQLLKHAAYSEPVCQGRAIALVHGLALKYDVAAIR